jgi:hypothetical protein
VNEPEPLPSNPKGWTSWVAARSRREIMVLIVSGVVVVAGVAWAIFTYERGSEQKLELLTYRVCVGVDQKLCPNGASFVRDAGEDTVTRWAQRECASYKTRRIIINDGPTKECGCYVADVTCSSE